LKVALNIITLTPSLVSSNYEKEQKDKQGSTKHTHKTKDRVTRTPLKTGGELRYSGRVGSYCSTSGIRRVNLITKERDHTEF
jgi:hypothetical protein